MTSTAKGIDVYGVDIGSNGRSCVSHDVCGHFVKEGDPLYCSWEVQEFDGETESVVQVHKLAGDGFVGCHIGYLPRRLIKASRSNHGDHKKDGGRSYDGTWLNVVADLRLSKSAAERSRSQRNSGIVYCHIIQDNPRFVGVNPFQTQLKPANDDDDDDDDGDDEDEDDDICNYN